MSRPGFIAPAMLVFSLLLGCSQDSNIAGGDRNVGLVVEGLALDATQLAALAKDQGLSRDDLSHMTRGQIERALRKVATPKSHYPDKWMESRLQVLRDENGFIPETAWTDGLADVDGLRSSDALTGGLAAGRWEELGPGNIGGRVRAVALDPTDGDTILVGSVSGGIWKTTDGGQHWSPTDDFLDSLAVTSIVFDPTNPDIVFAATGEGFFSGDALRGAGIFKSTDRGDTWSRLPSTNSANFHFCNRLAFLSNGAALLAATGSGIWRSTDRGVNWTQVLSGPDLDSHDVKTHPTNPDIAVAQFVNYDFGLLTWFHATSYTTNGGVTWTPSIGLRVNDYNGRIELAWHKGWTGAGNGCVYAMAGENGGTLYRSINGGQTFSVVAVTNPGIVGNQAWYDNALWIDPSDTNANVNDDRIVAGGIDLWRSTNGGQSFTRISEWWNWPTSAHADHHIIVEHPAFNGTTNRRVFFGNDGGLFKTQDYLTVAPLSGWINLNNGLRITQFYGASTDLWKGTIVGGTQDNGTLRYRPSDGADHSTMFGGDGGFCASDSRSNGYHYGEYVYGRVVRSSNDGDTAAYICGLRTNGTTWKNAPYKITDAENAFGNFIAPILLDPNNDDRLLVGLRSLWRTSNPRATNTNNTGPIWAAIKGPVTGNEPISAVAVAEGNSDVLWVGYNDGRIERTANGTASGPTFTRVDTNGVGLPDRYVTRITIDPTNANRVFVTLGGFNSNNLWMTTDNGASWSSFGGMPSVPLRDVEIHPTRPNSLYVASELGLLITEDLGATWTATNDGPANVSIDELIWMGGALVCVTHGRGIFRQFPGDPNGGALSGYAAPGNVNAFQGPPLDVLKVNWSAGGPDRRVDVPVGEPLVLSLDQPPSSPIPAPFLIFGFFGVPGQGDVVDLGTIGALVAPPCFVSPSNPLLITLANNVPGLAASFPCLTPLLPTAPGTLRFCAPTGLSFPTTLTLQGIVFDGNGNWTTTNALILNVYN